MVIQGSEVTETTYPKLYSVLNRSKTSSGAGICGTNNVFWRILMSPVTSRIFSCQANANGGKGYVIGATGVDGSLAIEGSEWREGIGRESSLYPISLYKAQLYLRLKLQNLIAAPKILVIQKLLHGK